MAIDETAQQFQSNIYEYLLENFGSHENNNEEEFSVKYASYSKNRLKKASKTLKNDEKVIFQNSRMSAGY